jgi:plasmid stability protein
MCMRHMLEKHDAYIIDATLQVRGLDEEVVAELKARAARKRMSLSAYVADILTEVAATPAPGKALAKPYHEIGWPVAVHDGRGFFAPVRRQSCRVRRAQSAIGWLHCAA